MDFGKRWYDPAIARFPSVDPLIEKFPFLTTYNYASNNPATNIDLHGLQGVNANTIKKFSNDLNENGLVKAKGNFFNFSSMTTGNGEQQETTVHRVNAVAKAIENAKSQAQGNMAKSAEKVLNEGSQVLVAAGEATETIGEGAQLAGSIITPVVPEVGIPLATAGAYTSRAGVVMQVTGHVGSGNYNEAGRTIASEAFSTGLLKPLRKLIEKMKSLTKIESEIINQQVDNVEIIIETAVEKKDKP